MPQIRLSTAVKAAVLAGLLAGLGLGLFHLVFTEPVIEKALVVEQQFAAAEADVVSRFLQKVGLLVGTLIFGGVLGALFAGPYALFHRWLPGASARMKAVILASLAYWSVSLFPFLKYPANPPGVGDPETIGFRQAIAIGFIALSVAGVGIAVGAYHLLEKRQRASSHRSHLLGVAIGYLAYAGTVYAVMPPNPDPVRMPADIMQQFRWLSISGMTALWAILGTVFAALWQRFFRNEAVAEARLARTS
ncbi:MAG: CbtA family protein [Chloroflexi bacterium]|nr:CbtA family protein [Chloroflexota bacterium]